jgi:hypothetical protein
MIPDYLRAVPRGPTTLCAGSLLHRGGAAAGRPPRGPAWRGRAAALVAAMAAVAIAGPAPAGASPGSAAGVEPRSDRAGARVVLADPDPELLRAVTSALAPWRIEVIVVDAAPEGAADASARAEESAARFIVWRRGDALVVFDLDRGALEESTGTAGTLDPVGAAAAALTIKALMRLPPPEDAPPDAPPAPPPLRPRPVGTGVRAQVGAGARLAPGPDAPVGARAAAALLVRPAALRGLHVGVAVEIGPASAVERAGFKGSWWDWAALGLATWTIPAGSREEWELEPLVGAGLMRGQLSGRESSAERRADATFAALRAGVGLRRHAGRIGVGAQAWIEARLGAPTYTKDGAAARVLEVATTAAAVGLVVAVDLGGAP